MANKTYAVSFKTPSLRTLLIVSAVYAVLTARVGRMETNG